METGLALLGLGITLAAFIFGWVWQKVNTANNKVIKELTAETRNLILEEGRLSREMLTKQFERMDQRFEKIGQLIVADGERTREIMREIKTGIINK